MRNRNRLWLLAWTLAALFPHIILYEISSTDNEAAIRNGDSSHSHSSSKEARGVFAPRMDYEQWKPLGRGDPLKNDPTYDYVPPVLDKVHYWMEPSSRKPDAPLLPNGEKQKTEILLLGVSSKKPSTQISSSGSSSISAESRRDTFDHFLKFVDSPAFELHNYHHKFTRPYYSSYFPAALYSSKPRPHPHEYIVMGESPRMPFTMLMPPPPSHLKSSIIRPFEGRPFITAAPSSVTAKIVATTPASFTIQQSNLLYHSSTIGNPEEFKEKGNYLDASSNQVTWRTPFSVTDTKPSNTKNNQTKSFATPTIKPYIVLSPSIETHEVMHKGLVTDANMDIQNTYVSIGKTEAQMMHPTEEISNHPSVIPQKEVVAHFLPTIKPSSTPMILTLQTLQTMQTMQPPPPHMSPPTKFSKPTISSLLKSEIDEKPIKKESTTTKAISVKTTPAPTSTTQNSLTTDPLFKHYKQPAEPIRGPLYLIIQGHSKVKTYGPAKQIHGISVQESNNEIPTVDEDDMKYSVKHLHGYKRDHSEVKSSRQGRSGPIPENLSDVVDMGVGAVDFGAPEVRRRISVGENDKIKGVDLEAGYEVADADTVVTSERYHKGIVEAGEISRSIKETNKTKITGE